MRKQTKIIKNVIARSIVLSSQSTVQILIKSSRKYKASDVESMKLVSLYLLNLTDGEYKYATKIIRKESYLTKPQNNLFYLNSCPFVKWPYDLNSSYGITHSPFLFSTLDLNSITNVFQPDKTSIKKRIILEQESYNIIKNLILT